MEWIDAHGDLISVIRGSSFLLVLLYSFGNLSSPLFDHLRIIKMGLLMSKVMTLFKEWSEGSPSRVLMLGLDAAGRFPFNIITFMDLNC